MKYFKAKKFFLGIVLTFVSSLALAKPNMNTIYVQGYLRKSTGTAVTDGNYSMVFSIRAGATYFWTSTIVVPVSSGFFSQALSGASSAPYAGSIDSATLAASASGALAVNVQTTVDGQAVSFDVQSAPAPLALLADKAASVVSGSIDTTALGSGSVTSSKIGANAVQDTHFAVSGVLPAWNGAALTNINASSLSTGTLPSAVFPTTLPATSGANLTSLPAANLTGTLPAISGANLTSLSAANLTGTLPAISGANLTSLPAANLTGTLPAISGANLTSLNATNISSGTLSSSVFPATVTGASALTLQGASGSATTVGQSAGASALTLQSGASGAMALNSGTGTITATSTNTTASAIALTASGVGGGIALSSNSGGVVINGAVNQPVTIGGGTTTGTINIGNSSGAQPVNIGSGAGTGNITVGNTGAASLTKVQAGTGKILVQSNSVTGVAFSAMGACTITSFTCASGANTAKTCTGVPSTSAVVYCSPASGAGTNNPTWGVFPTAANTVTLNISAVCTVASAWNCMWVVP